MKLIDLYDERAKLINKLKSDISSADYMVSNPTDEEERKKKTRFQDLVREFNLINDRINSAMIGKSITVGDYGSMSLMTARDYLVSYSYYPYGLCPGAEFFSRSVVPVNLMALVTSRNTFDDSEFFDGCCNNMMNKDDKKKEFKDRETAYSEEMYNTLMKEFLKVISETEA